MNTLCIVGGHGYVGRRVVAAATTARKRTIVISRTGDTRFGTPSVALRDLPGHLAATVQPASVIWLLDGAKHQETDQLRAILPALPPAVHVTAASTCTVYGARGDTLCSETSPLQPLTPHAQVKVMVEQLLANSGRPHCVLRLGALYGVDERGARRDRIEKWVAQAVAEQQVVVPEPEHWRGWLHREQAARALLRAGERQLDGTFNVVSANYTFGQAAGFAAAPFGALVVGEGRPDLCSYRVDTSKARAAGLLDVRAEEELPATVEAYATARFGT